VFAFKIMILRRLHKAKCRQVAVPDTLYIAISLRFFTKKNNAKKRVPTTSSGRFLRPL